MKKLAAALMLAFAAAQALPAFADDYKSGPRRVTFVEVYTAEGKKESRQILPWLSELSKSPDLWKKFVPAAFHVDPGRNQWRGALAKPESEERLKALLAKWRASSPYLPLVAVDGVEWNGWADDKELPSTGEETGILRAERKSKDEISVAFEPADKDHHEWVAYAAMLGSGIRTRVESGENIGRSFRHDLAVLAYGYAPMVAAKKGEGYECAVSLPQQTSLEAETLYLAVWVTKEDSVIPVQATGGILPRYIEDSVSLS
jgi:hypothetical protein